MSKHEKCSHVIPDLLGGSPRKCKRDALSGLQHCWQHATSGATPKSTPVTSPRSAPRLATPKTPRKRTPKKSPSKQRKVHFSEKTRIRKIPPRNKHVKGGIAWAEPVTEMQAECISSVMGAYGIWDREDLEKAKHLSPNERRLITTCIRILEGDTPSSPYQREVLAFSSYKDREADTYRQKAMVRENKF